MKLKKISFENNKIFGNLEIDFTDSEGKVVDTIILAGENGCGKTTLLNYIYDNTGVSSSGQQSPEIRIYNYLLENEEINITKSIFPNFYNEVEIYYDFSKGGNNYIPINKIRYNAIDNSSNIKWEDGNLLSIINNKRFKEMFSSMYSTVEINYNSSNINSITSKELDENLVIQNKFGEKSNNEIGTEIKQLFVDIQSNDANDLAQWVNDHPNEIPPEEIKNIRMNRFKNAFDFIFNNLKYSCVKSVNGYKEVYFQKNNNLISIDTLSSGEKQIVFRGGFLLKNIQMHNGHIILIDEPEISLHPNWQKEILGYYKKLFTNNEGKQTSQIFIATHSPFILDSNYRYNDKVIILKNNGGLIEILDKPNFYSSGEITEIREAFNVNYFNKESETYILTEGETDEKYINEYFKLKGINNYIVQWVGRNINNKAVNTGSSALEHFKDFMISNPNIIKANIILLYDCDTNKQKYQNRNLKEICLAYNKDNKLYKKGIENLLTIPATFPKDKFYSSTTAEDEYGAIKQIQKLDKMKLCNYICSLPNQEKENFFSKFEIIIKLIND